MRELDKAFRMQITSAAPTEPGSPGEGPPRLRIMPVSGLAEDVLKRSGIRRGMRVLDLECGIGETSLVIARLVGYSGLVVGVDRSPQAIDAAERRATMAGCCYWTRFIAADPESFLAPDRFDAVVVRLALLCRGERAALLRISACVHPGGILLVSGKSAANVVSTLRRIGWRLP
jgi:ubiquinone/menaquinone biosynthesis C-methylase UbiE